jgi:hypothetical protein
LVHQALVRGNNQRYQIDAVYPGKHVLHESFVPRYIYKADPHVAQIEVSETQVDGDAAFFFFRKTIGIFAGEGVDQRTLAVIDMTCGTNNY